MKKLICNANKIIFLIITRASTDSWWKQAECWALAGKFQCNITTLRTSTVDDAKQAEEVKKMMGEKGNK